MKNIKHKHREKVQLFVNKELELEVRAIKNDDASISLNAEDTAIGFGFTQIKNGKTYVRWETMNGYCKELNFSQHVGKDDYIPESLFYLLGMKANNDVAKKFQMWLATEVLPSMRKYGMYATDELLDNPDLLIAAATKLKEERAARLEAEKQRDKLVHQNKLYTTSEIAKELGLSSATKLNNLLSEKKIQYKQNKTWLLYSKYSELGLVSIKQDVLDNGKIIYDRKWTGKGRDFILNLF
ncbi:phage antirepressor KilAC domain-containing protein [uncultured Clostridium sp.]|jgi:prophage antirepressor-like protein|uniref:phage antirepressor KilAC domain-containing protein n=2 Tax=Clostridium TaxID=1485 RepID=UPI0020572D90|nr:phage antirepressor KilAC domain-containing protein [uncultured Clostridium sp.]DAZ49751.1 MAG TPA: antirepressor protein [Caudoviricetes sp.]